MKTKNIISLILITICNSVSGQTGSSFSYDQFLESDNFISHVKTYAVPKNFALPSTREIRGGTKIVPIYENDLRMEAQGAFEYACKIWEEALPTTFPIRIIVRMDDITTVPDEVYSVVSPTYMTNIATDISPATTLAQAKATTFGDRTHLYRRNPEFTNLDSLQFFMPEMIITYYNKNNRLYENCSFSRDGLQDNTKYDFVTMALRDIARGLGICSRFSTKTVNGQTYLRTRPNLDPFQKRVSDSLSSDSCQAYLQATQGSLNIGGYYLYAPSIWDKKASLNYFLPDDTKKITQLLDYNFGRGSVVREISDDDLAEFINYYLYWTSNDNGLTVGGNGQSHREQSTSTSDCFNFHGTISVNSNASLQHSESLPV